VPDLEVAGMGTGFVLQKNSFLPFCISEKLKVMQGGYPHDFS
jgi:hypothetical protein